MFASTPTELRAHLSTDSIGMWTSTLRYGHWKVRIADVISCRDDIDRMMASHAGSCSKRNDSDGAAHAAGQPSARRRRDAARMADGKKSTASGEGRVAAPGFEPVARDATRFNA
jgi:hypothetical protein